MFAILNHIIIHQVIGKASVLDEIINYIQALQHQVEVCSAQLLILRLPIRCLLELKL